MVPPIRKTRRHSPIQLDDALITKRGNEWVAGIGNAEIARLFAKLVAGFEHVESDMGSFLALLLGMTDDGPAKCVYNSLRNPNIRLDIMRSLLENSANNSSLGPDFDKLLSGYDTVRKARNRYAHALWWTDPNDTVFMAEQDMHGFAIANAKPVHEKDLAKEINAQIDFRNDLLFVGVMSPMTRRLKLP